MRKIYLFICTIICSFHFCQDWKLITKDNEETTYGKEKRQNGENNIEINLKTYSKSKKYYDKNGNVAIVYNCYTKDLREYNCNDRKYRFLYLVIYNANGNAIKHVNRASSWNYVIPDSYGEKIFKYACCK